MVNPRLISVFFICSAQELHADIGQVYADLIDYENHSITTKQLSNQPKLRCSEPPKIFET